MWLRAVPVAMTNRLKKNCISVSDASYGFIIAASSSRDVAAEYFHFGRIARHVFRFYEGRVELVKASFAMILFSTKSLCASSLIYGDSALR